MFNVQNPPFLILPVSAEGAQALMKRDGYTEHVTSDGKIYVSYEDGWTLPVSAENRKLIDAEPLLLLRNSGRITSEGSTFTKGFAHQFCQANGSEITQSRYQSIFPDRPNDKWMLIPESAAVIWLQYSNKTQFLGEMGQDSERFYYGKLLISTLTIKKDSVPRLDKNADNLSLRSMQYRVEEKVLITRDWNTTDEVPEEYLNSLLAGKDLGNFSAVLSVAITRATSR